MSTIERQSQVAVDSAGALVSRASQQIAELVREEMEPARAEMTEEGKRYRTGGGFFAAAGVRGLLGAQALLATCIAALALVLPVWAAGPAITAVLVAAAAVKALAGKRHIAQVGLLDPEQILDSDKADLAEGKEKAHR
ncbi:phage holin family protein [Streptomyces sp. NPDC059989]|uniref:phage holin family protein n=1 Tax=Streptomyces sp. NPDC059989 TaxID=3347026 RepID=UPI0036C33DB4